MEITKDPNDDDNLKSESVKDILLAYMILSTMMRKQMKRITISSFVSPVIPVKEEHPI